MSGDRFGSATDVFIYSKVRSCHTRCQMSSDYRDAPKGIIAAMNCLYDESQTYLERAMESSDFGYLILHHFASIWDDFWLICGGDSGVWGINLHFSETQSRFRESRK